MGSRVNGGFRNADFRFQEKETKVCNLQPPARTGNGFTLLEVLLALSILALVVTAVYASFSTTGRNIEKAEVTRDSTDLARTLVAKMSSDIANAYVNSAMAGKTIFYGGKKEFGTGNDKQRYDVLSLTTLTNWRKSDSQEMDLWEVGYFFTEKSDVSGYVMMRREKRVLSTDMPAGEGGVEYQITDRVKGLQLRYNNGGDTWYDEWTTKNAQPQIVEIALTLDSGMTYTTRVKVELWKH
jgi:type II secretion system protein J